MAYRDDREALHHRVAQLEEELVAARQEGEAEGRDAAAARAAELEKKLRDMRGDLEKMEAELQTLRGGRTGTRVPVAIAVGAGLAVAMGVGLVATMRAKPPPPPPPEPLTLPPVVTQVQPVAPQILPVPSEPAPVPEVAPSPLRTTQARWNATVTKAEGLGVAPGTACAIEVTIQTTETNAHTSDVSIMCGTQKLYRSRDRLEGMAQLSSDAREQLGASDEKSTFTLAYRDIGTRSGERTQVDLDTTKRLATVFRDTLPRFRVDLAVPVASVPTAALAGVDQRLRRTGTVQTVTGGAPIKAGAKCVLRAMATGKQADCVAEVTCGTAVLLPPTTPATCTYEGSRPVGVAVDQGANTLTLVGWNLAVKTKSFSAIVNLEE